MRRCTRGHVATTILTALAATVLLCAGGCQTRVIAGDGRPMPGRPRPAPRVPAGTIPDQMTLVVGPKPEDTDGNGFPDRIQVASSLFSRSHPTPLQADGAFVFTLYRHGEARVPDAKPLGEWRFEGDAVRLARGVALYGTCYRFSLSLRETGSERLPATRGDIRGRYEPSSGGPTVYPSDVVRDIQIGRSAFSDAK